MRVYAILIASLFGASIAAPVMNNGESLIVASLSLSAVRPGNEIRRTVAKAGDGSHRIEAKAGDGSHRTVAKAGNETPKTVVKVGNETPRTAAKAGDGTPKTAVRAGDGSPKAVTKVGKGRLRTEETARNYRPVLRGGHNGSPREQPGVR
ncbi:hypothetical protein NP233_g5847 [Leucocoprinus birnbaumii]|uniref:Uncharacterized protein n=1 Tax=Leucocoprinus birnbaumii TaxID=56174 RepID=A0AAD5YW35_9AGAR|nr:hypothetical protein NP233_g5847 [Leucocoprinus birnbaumii]